MTAAVQDKPKLFPLRQRTGTAAHHLSKRAVDFGQEDLHALSEKEAVLLLAKLRWGSETEMPCPHCGTMDSHYWTAKELRWKCKGCGKRFSATSGSVLADHKLPVAKILKMVYSWATSSSGTPSLELRREWKVSYRAVFTLMHKLREGLLRAHNVGFLCGVQEVDGMDANGRRYREKRNKPQGGGGAPKPVMPADKLTPKVDQETGEIKEPPKPIKWDKKQRQPADRRIVLVVRQRSVSKGRGGVGTRIAVAFGETSQTVMTLAKRFISAESTIMSDEDPAYHDFGKHFAKHESVAHSKAFSLPGGISNNLAESFNARIRRLLEGVYLNVSNKYLADYAAEAAWREDVRRLSTGKRLTHLLGTVLWAGLSNWWRGFAQGEHREEELLVEGNAPAKPRGRKKGWKARPPK